MQHAHAPLLLGLASVLLAAPITGCDSGKAGTETASAGATVTANKGAIPITTASEEARRLYLQGRDLTEQLRAFDGRQLYQQAVEKDPSFAMAHYQLAVNSATAKDFFDHLKEAVALSDQATEGERLVILATEAGGNADAAKALEYLEELVTKYPDDERAHFQLGNNYFGRQEFPPPPSPTRRTAGTAVSGRRFPTPHT